MPKISIIVNCFNGEKYLKQALDSIYAQTFEDWEIVFFDNNSSDSSAEIAKKYNSKLIYYKNSETIPLGYARKQAVNMSSGDWITFLDTDDYWLPDNLSTQVPVLDSGNYCLSYAGIREVAEDGTLIRNYLPLHKSGNIFPELLRQYDINIVTPLVNRKILLDKNLNFEPIITASEEYNLFMRLAAKGNIAVINKILGVYRVSDNSLTNRQISKWAFERRYTLEQIESENPGISKTYSVEFAAAYARASYYEARYLMVEKNYTEANRVMKSISGQSKTYGFLYALTFVPFLWFFIHSKSLKRKLSSILEKLYART